MPFTFHLSFFIFLLADGFCDESDEPNDEEDDLAFFRGNGPRFGMFHLRDIFRNS